MLRERTDFDEAPAVCHSKREDGRYANRFRIIHNQLKDLEPELGFPPPEQTQATVSGPEGNWGSDLRIGLCGVFGRRARGCLSCRSADLAGVNA